MSIAMVFLQIANSNPKVLELWISYQQSTVAVQHSGVESGLTRKIRFEDYPVSGLNLQEKTDTTVTATRSNHVS
jgi:hypothetical protein